MRYYTRLYIIDSSAVYPLNNNRMIYTRGKSKIDGPADTKYRTKYELYHPPTHTRTRAPCLSRSRPRPLRRPPPDSLSSALGPLTSSRLRRRLSSRPSAGAEKSQYAVLLHRIPFRTALGHGHLCRTIRRPQAPRLNDSRYRWTRRVKAYQTYQRPAIYYYTAASGFAPMRIIIYVASRI